MDGVGLLDARSFSLDDQRAFAALTGDRNPMHLDPLAARRTQAGAPVVHGIHSLLWLLECIARQRPGLPPLVRLKVQFPRMLHVGQRAEAALARLDAAGLSGSVSVGGVVAVQLKASFGPVISAPLDRPGGEAPMAAPGEPLEPAMEAMAGMAGALDIAPMTAGMERMFPHAARLLGVRRLAALGGATLLVGMVLPGLHSMFSGLQLDCCAEDGAGLGFRVASVEERFRLVKLHVFGGGLCGTLDAFVRQPPTPQADMAAVAARVAADEFAGSTALVIGGSRGLGELTAKIIAAGGGQVIITYAAGKADAERVVADITAWGGRCRVLPYDVRKDAADPFAFDERPTQLYYFATPPIFGQSSELFSEARFQAFSAFYVAGFARAVEAAHRRRPEGISVFFPSSVAVEERPAHMTEYAMAKAAGEILCADLDPPARNIRTTFRRLPRLLTDQTATLQSIATPPALEILLPIIRSVQRPL